MTIRQLYYTSCRHPQTGRTGFQVKAESPGIAPGTLDVLQRVLGYRLPPSLMEQPTTAHPVALRYTPLAGGEAVLVCIHSSGLDEFDRPGNYFAHAVLGPAEQITRVYPPITYWNSPFWASRDDTPRTELPVSADFTADTAFDHDAVWPFLDQGPRRAWFRALLSAVVDYAHARRPVVIVDSPANTALWVYAVSMALPSRFRPMLSFATYHHDPLAAPFVIAGTTPEGIADRPGAPRFTLDTLSDSVDEAPPSPFAAYICDHFTAEGYETEILEFLDWAEARDDRATGITHLLDDLALFYVAARRSSRLSAPELERAAAYIVEDAAGTAGAYPQDAADLRAAAAIYAELLVQSNTAEHLDSYQRALIALAQVDADISDTALAAVGLYLGCILDRQVELAASLGRFIGRLYPVNVVADALNQPELLERLARLLRTDDAQQMLLFWQQVGPRLRFDGPGQDAIVDAILTTFAALQPTPPPDPLAPPPEAAALLDAFAAALAHQHDLALRTAHFYQQRHPRVSVLEWVYGALAAPLPLRQRAAALWPYWDAFTDVADLRAYDIRSDLRAISDSGALGARVAEWQTALAAAGHASALEIVIQTAWTRPGLDRQRFALAALTDDRLAAALDAGWRDMLLEAALSGAAIELPDAATVDLYSRLIASPRLPLTAAQRAAVEGALALHSGRFPTGAAAASLCERLAALDAGTYHTEAQRLLGRFFTAETHPDLVRALYVRPHRDDFWALYWERFGAALLDEQRGEDTAAIMEAWFARSGALVSDAPYALPEFFFQLPAALDSLRANRRYAQVGRAFEAQLAAYDWYPLLQKTLAGRAGGRGLFGSLFDR